MLWNCVIIRKNEEREEENLKSKKRFIACICIMSMILSGISVSAANDAATEEGQSMESSQMDQNQQQMNDEADQEIRWNTGTK